MSTHAPGGPDHKAPTTDPRAPLSGTVEVGGPTRAPSAPMSAPSLQRLGGQIGNRRLTRFLGKESPLRSLQRIPITVADAGETLYEDAPGGATAANKQYVATDYGGGGTQVKYDMDRTATDAVVSVKIQFLDQRRGENPWLKDKFGQFVIQAGQKVPDPTYARDIGTPAEIPAGDPRRAFATTKCDAITGAWNHYDLLSKSTPKAPVGGDATIPAPPPTDVRLPLKFVAVPEFGLAAPGAHAQVRLYGMGVIADRSGAHPIDAGHWYMDTTTNYGDMDLNAVSAHEYGHLIGLQDEYFRNDDQTHQLIHRMGGGAKNADKALDRHTLRIMVTSALFPAIQARMSANIGTVTASFEKAKPTLRKQLGAAVEAAWTDAGIRDAMIEKIHPALKYEGLKKVLPSVVKFETSQNLPAASRATEAVADLSGQRLATFVTRLMANWQRSVTGAAFVTDGADGSKLGISTEVSANITSFGTTGPGQAEGTAVADRVGGGGAPNPKILPSSTLLGQLEALPREWKDPGRGIDTAYTPAVLAPELAAAVDAAVATGVIPNIRNVRDLYVRVLNLVTSTSRASTKKAFAQFVANEFRPKVMSQLEALGAQIDAEVDAAMSMPAGALASKQPPDPAIQATATKLAALLKSQQSPLAYDQAPDIIPGAGSAGTDVRHTAGSMMGTNVMEKSGFRSDMIQPVLQQWNKNLKKADEDDFTAKVTR